MVIGRYFNTVVVTLRGTLDTLAATRLSATLHDLIDGQGNLTIALDLQRLDQVVPSALQVFAVAADNLERRGGSMRLHGPNGRVRKALDAVRLSRLIGDAGGIDPTTGGREAPHSLGAHAGRGARASHPAGTGRAPIDLEPSTIWSESDPSSDVATARPRPRPLGPDGERP
jgi:anti-anti-sigma factor